MSARSDFDRIRRLIAQNDLREALRELQQLPESRHLTDDLIGLERRLQHLRREERLGTLTWSEANRTRNTLVRDLLEYVSEIERGGAPIPPDLLADAAFEPAFAEPPETSTAPAETAPDTPPPETNSPEHPQGHVLHSIPPEMRVGERTLCEVRIGFDAAQLRVEHGRPNDATVAVRSVRLGSRMSVELRGATDDFRIEALNREQQFVERDRGTEWWFDVTPLRAGAEQLLTLIVRVFEQSDGEWVARDRVLHERIRVSTANASPSASPHPLRTPSEGAELPGAATIPLAETTPTLLWLSANPNNRPRLDTEREFAAVEDLLHDEVRDQKVLLHYQPSLTTTRLLRALRRHRPQLVHFSGHGEDDGIVVETDAGTAQRVPKEALGNLFKKYADTVRCVVLSACFSQDQATTIRTHVPVVIGSNLALLDADARAFALEFYRCLIDELTGDFPTGAAFVTAAREAYENGLLKLQMDGHGTTAAGIMWVE